MNDFIEILQRYPELALFLVLAIGFAIGKISIGSFKVGAVLGTLFAGVLIGQFNISVAPVVKVIFFDLFLFATGYKVGPQFFRGLKKDAVPQLILTFVICVTCLLTAFVMSKLMGFDVGTAAGMLAGAFTESTVIGTASESIQRLSIPGAEKTILLNNIPVAYAVTYLVGTTFLVWFLSSLAPKLLKIDLKSASRDLEKKLLGKSEDEDGIESAFEDWRLRAFKITNVKWNGLTIGDLEKSAANFRIFIHRIRRDGKIVEPNANTFLYTGDVIAVMARYKVFFQNINDIGPEVMDRELLDFPIAYRDLIITNKNLSGKTLGEIGIKYGQGVKLHKLIRTGQEIPFNVETIINRGDLLKISGLLPDVERTAKTVGYIDRVSDETDIIFVGLGILLGGLVGLLAVTIGGISITLTTSGGALVMGLVFGWLRSKTPKFGHTTAGLKAIQDAAGSKLPVLGYTVPYALGNILLTAWGPVIVAMMNF